MQNLHWRCGNRCRACQPARGRYAGREEEGGASTRFGDADSTPDVANASSGGCKHSLTSRDLCVDVFPSSAFVSLDIDEATVLQIMLDANFYGV